MSDRYFVNASGALIDNEYPSVDMNVHNAAAALNREMRLRMGAEAEVERLRAERDWVRKKIGVPLDSTRWTDVCGPLHILESHANGYTKYIEAHRCDDKQGEIARQSVEIERLRAYLKGIEFYSECDGVHHAEPCPKCDAHFALEGEDAPPGYIAMENRERCEPRTRHGGSMISAAWTSRFQRCMTCDLPAQRLLRVSGIAHQSKFAWMICGDCLLDYSGRSTAHLTNSRY